MSYLNISKAAIEFWTGFNDYTDDTKAKALCYWAGKKAYLDMNRTLTFNKEKAKELTDSKRKDIRNGAIKIMYSAFKNIGNEYNKWHEALCTSIINHYCENNYLTKRNNKKSEGKPMSIGQAQKWINMTIKYIWLVYSVSSDNLDYYKELMNKKDDFHIPLDSIILKYIHDEHIVDYDLIKNYTWSQIDDYTEYSEYQQAIRDKINYNPLEWELVHWIKAVNKNKKNKDSDVYSKWK